VLEHYGVDGGVLNAVYASNRHMSVALRAFIDFVAERSLEADG
jgi:DNA-binding transcriptional LysR family regulator